VVSPVYHASPALRDAGENSETKRVTRAAGVVALATLLSRVLGFVRDAMIAATFGAAFSSDAFLAAFRIPNLFRRLVGEGALNSAFVPVFTETFYRGGPAEAERLFGSTSRVFAAVLTAVCAVGVLTAGWLVPLVTPGFTGAKLALTVSLTRMMFPYLFAAGMMALCMGALNVYGSFAAPALTPTLLNLCMIGSLAAVPLPKAGAATDAATLSVDPIMATLYDRYRIEVVASVWPASPGRVLRVSAQIYNEEAQYRRLAAALKEALAAGA